MKLHRCAMIAVLCMVGCAGLAQKRAAQIETARNAIYEQPRKVVWDELYMLMSQEYAISSQTEHTGVIDTEWRYEQQGQFRRRRQIRAEIVGNGPFRVSFRATLLREEPSGEWRELDGKEYEDELYLLLYDRLRLGASDG